MKTMLGKQLSLAVAPEERSVLQYKDAFGNVTVLTDLDGGIITMPGMQGFGDMPYSLLTKALPAVDGEALLGISAGARPLTVPLFIEDETRPRLLLKRRELQNAMDPRDGQGELQVLQPDGSGRRIAVLYSNGMEGDEGTDVTGLHWETYSIAFRALQPAWLDLADVFYRWVIGTDDPFFPILPLTLTASQIIGSDVLVTNVGDEWAYPIWKVTGKMSAITVVNNNTGLSFTVNRSQIDSSQWTTIDTRPGVKSIVDQAGTNLWPSVSPNPKLWPLVRGDNSVGLLMSGTDASSFIEMSYTPRYKAAA